MMQMKNTPLYRTTPWGGMPEPCFRKAPSKVVSIPVHFVGSERTRTNSDSATEIQRVLRGFLVRNTLRKITAMRVELERIESEISVEVMKLKREQRERVRVSETIMNLLLKLDSVRVLHYSGLRECRKSLINKAIALQEMLDQMAVTHSDEMEEKESECVEAKNCLVEEEEEEEEGEGSGMETLKNGEIEMEEEEGKVKWVREDNCLVKEEEDNGIETLRSGEVERQKEESGCMEEESIGLGKSLVVEKEGEIECEEEQEEGEEIEALRNEEVEDKEGVGTSSVAENCLMKEEGGDYERAEGDGKKKDLLEKMMEDNQKMVEMMTQLFQRNEMQTTLLTSLSQRVEQLERALACEKLRRKKKRKADAKIKRNNPKNGFI
ncbi:hypothetical protein JHK82_051860 [Glycine max]|nr:hypothetical protein JHK86_051695 [Glycine max]KAG4926051.1 hypothetical protein JHK87_051591 [Glycine soja]KAG5093082.1 hypothetical protein JHK82_051860 [Glycine max]KAG5096147.1 hypothetical protein JHK84_051735 [Glycine max]